MRRTITIDTTDIGTITIPAKECDCGCGAIRQTGGVDNWLTVERQIVQDSDPPLIDLATTACVLRYFNRP